MEIWILLITSFILANIPWLSERFMFFVATGEDGKRAWMRLLEWLLLYFIAGGIALGLESKVTGGLHSQHWQFYVVTFCLFLVFALPGFIYRHDLRHLLERHRR